MRGVFSRRIAAALLVVVLATPAMASHAADPGLWAQFLVWLDGRIGIPGGDPVEIEDWIVAMGRIGIPNG